MYDYKIEIDKNVINANYYCVSQSDYGHEYRWVFKANDFRKALEERGYTSSNIDEDWGADIGFPIGGSNSSSTWWSPIETEEEALEFLRSPALGPDYEDPELCDIGEYCLTVDTWQYKSYTKELLDKYGIDAKDLEQVDDEYHRYDKVKQMAAELKAAGCTEFDCDDPFYGENSDMTYNELVELYNDVCDKKEEMVWS